MRWIAGIIGTRRGVRARTVQLVAGMGAAAIASSAATTACAQERAPAPSAAEGDVANAERLLARGERDAARRAAAAVVSRLAGSSRAVDQIAVGRAYVVMGDAASVRSALSAFDAATRTDPSNPEGELRAGNLFLDKYNAPDARVSFNAVLKAHPTNARAVLGLARVEDFENKGNALATTQKALTLDPALVEARVMLARLFLEAEQYDSAATHARRAIALDSTSLPAWSLLGAEAWLTGDSAAYNTARAAASRLQPRPSDFLVEIADAAVRTRRYAEAVRLASQAVAYDSQSVRALGVLGTNQMRLGQTAEGQRALDRAFALDPFNLWHKNTLDLLDRMKTFKTVTQGRFVLVAPADEADLLALYLVPMLDRAYDSLSVRYGFRAPTPVRLELFSRHADFSVRTVGLAGLGALGVSFGSTLAMDTPSARDRGAFNFGSTALHELTHAFTLGASEHRVPRWMSEGMSVLEERRYGQGWGADASLEYLTAFARGQLRPISQLNEGFLHPRHPEETGFSYYEASLFCEMVEQLKGAKALPAMLVAYRDGLDTPGVFKRVLGMTPEQVDAQFELWTRAKFAKPLAAAVTRDSTVVSDFVKTMRTAVALSGEGAAPANRDSIRALFERALSMFPDYAGPDGPAWHLARLAKERGDNAGALVNVSRVTLGDETAWDANVMEAELREAAGDDAGAIAALQRLLWISPYDVTLHRRMATLATKRNDHALAVRERRAVVATNPADLADARYELARALAATGDVTGARRELLAVLEQAPSFEKAQALLLELRARAGAPR